MPPLTFLVYVRYVRVMTLNTFHPTEKDSAWTLPLIQPLPWLVSLTHHVTLYTDGALITG